MQNYLKPRLGRPWTHDRDTASSSPHGSSLSSQRPELPSLLCSFANLPLSGSFPSGFSGAACPELLSHNSQCQVVSPLSKKPCNQFPFFLVSPAVTFKHTNWFLWDGDGCEAARMCRALLCQGSLCPSSVSGIKSLLIYLQPLPAMSQLSSSVTVTPDGSSGLRIQLWVKVLAIVSLHSSFFEDSFPLYFPSLGLNQLPHGPSK